MHVTLPYLLLKPILQLIHIQEFWYIYQTGKRWENYTTEFGFEYAVQLT